MDISTIRLIKKIDKHLSLFHLFKIYELLKKVCFKSSIPNNFKVLWTLIETPYFSQLKEFLITSKEN